MDFLDISICSVCGSEYDIVLCKNGKCSDCEIFPTKKNNNSKLYVNCDDDYEPSPQKELPVKRTRFNIPNPNVCVLLKIPYKNKDKAKSEGCFWSKSLNKWYIEPDFYTQNVKDLETK